MNKTQQPGAAPKTILLVEDDRDIQDALIDLLEGEGYVVRSAANGQEGIDSLQTEGLPDLILLDLMMPVKDGTQFRQEQKADPRISQVPVLVMSADTKVLEKSTAIGARGFLRKPIEVEDLLREVAAILSEA